MGSVHVVIGRTGEYADHQEWNVAAFTSKQRAETLARRANEWCERNGCTSDRRSAPAYYSSEPRPENPYDPGMALDYTGTSYGVLSVPLDPPLPRRA